MNFTALGMAYGFVVVDIYDNINLKTDVRPAFGSEGRSTKDVESDVANIVEHFDTTKNQLFCLERGKPEDQESIDMLLDYFPEGFPKDALYVKKWFSPFTGNVYRHKDKTVGKFESMISKEVDTVVISGFDLIVCVINTAIDFAKRGYDVYLIKDLLLTDHKDISETLVKIKEYNNIRLVDSYDSFKAQYQAKPLAKV